MPDSEKKLVARVVAQDDTKGVFQKLGQDIGAMEKNTGSLTTSMAKLGVAGLAAYAALETLKAGFEFLKGSLKEAAEAETTMIRVRRTIQNMGGDFSEIKPKIDAFSESMIQLGFQGDDAAAAVGRLFVVTKNYEEAQKLANLATDLARFQNISLAEATQKVIMVTEGNAKSLIREGLELKENASAAENLNTLYGLVRGTSVEFSESATGKLEILNAQWAELKQTVGNELLPYAKELADYLIKNLPAIESGIKRWAEKAKSFGDELKTAYGWVKWIGDNLTISGKLNQILKGTKDETKGVADETKAWSNNWAEVQAQIDANEAKFNNKPFAGSYPGDAKNATDVTDKLKDAFRALSKTIVDTLEDQKKAIDDLRRAHKELQKDLDADLTKADKDYKNRVSDEARQAKDRMADIDKQIKDEQSRRETGWRTRVEELEKEKAKEQAIINKAGGIVNNIESQLSKDRLDILKDEFDEQSKLLVEKASGKRGEIDTEIAAREQFARGITTSVSQKGFYDTATKEGSSFLGAIGQSALQQSLTFVFNGDVAGDEGIKKIIAEAVKTLDRTATLKAVGGK